MKNLTKLVWGSVVLFVAAHILAACESADDPLGLNAHPTESPSSITTDAHWSHDEALALALSAFTGSPTSVKEVGRMGPDAVYHSLMIAWKGDESSMAQALTDLTGTLTSPAEAGRVGPRMVFHFLWSHYRDADPKRLVKLSNWHRSFNIVAEGDESMALELTGLTGTPTSPEQVKRMGPRAAFLTLWSLFERADLRRLAAGWELT